MIEAYRKCHSLRTLTRLAELVLSPCAQNRSQRNGEKLATLSPKGREL